MRLTRAAIAYDRLTFTALAMVMVFGALAFRALPRDEDPGFTIRAAQVITAFPGAGPLRVEQLVTDPLEQAIRTMPELDFVTSESATGISVITVNIRPEYTAMQPIWDSLRRKVDAARARLPDDAGVPQVNDEFGDVFGIVLALRGEGYSYATLKEVGDAVRDTLLRVDQVAKVDIHGAQAQRLFVEYSNARLAELGVSPAQLGAALGSANIIVPGGAVTVGSERIVLEPTGNFESDADAARTVLNLPGGGVAFLGDIATVRRGYVDPPTALVRANGAPALAIAVSMRRGGNILKLGRDVREALDELRARYPWGVELEVVADLPGRVRTAVDGFVLNLAQAVAVVAGVMLLALGLRTGLVVAVLVPATLALTFLVMQVAGIGLDRISLAALIVALGLLVDNGIVLAESIQVQMREGRGALEAAVEAAGELWLALLTSTVTTAAAFLPIFLAEATVGEFTAPLFLVTTIALTASWLVTMTVIPLLCARFLRPAGPPAGAERRVTATYARVLRMALARPAHVLAMTVVALAVAVWAFRFVPNIFFPPSEQPFFVAELELPAGSDIRAIEAVVAAADKVLGGDLAAPARAGGVTHHVAYVGDAGPRFTLGHTPEPARAYYAYLLVHVDGLGQIGEVMAGLERALLARFPDLTVQVKRMRNGPPVEKPVEVRLLGPDPDVLFAHADAVKARLREIPGTRALGDDWGARAKKLLVQVDQARARRAAVSNRDIAVSLQTGLSGLGVTELREGDELIPVVLRSVAADRQDLGKLETLNVYSSSTGASVPLRQVADIRVEFQPSQIRRRDRERAVTVSAELAEGVLASQVTARMLPWLRDELAPTLAPGYRYEIGGEYESSADAQSAIAAKAPVAALVIALAMVAQFNSLRRAALVLLTVPLGLIGVVLGLLLTRETFGFMTLLGVVALTGIVVNNAIVLLDRVRLERAAGLGPRAALAAACTRRLRPVLLTTVTTVAGMLPLWLGGGPLFASLAVAMVFGLVVSTVLTLVVVPAAYLLVVERDAGA